MLVRIPHLLTPEEVAHCRGLLARADWVDGKVTAGGQSAKAKLWSSLRLKVWAHRACSTAWGKRSRCRNQWETLDLNVTTTPVDYDGRRLSLLLLEDQTEVVTLRQIIPICMKCGKVRDGEDYWQRVDAYLSKTYQVGVSHGVCPTCLPAYRREFLGESADGGDRGVA